MNRPPQHPHELFLDLSNVEGNAIAYLLIEKTDASRTKAGLDHPDGLTICTEVGAHGGDVHLDWAEVKVLRDTLSRLLAEVGED